MSSRQRKYVQKLRAVTTEETRRRIIEAAVSLHTTIGPSRTTFTAVAERAGVSRPTVYRHFPNLPSLFAACMSHGQTADPLPDPNSWSSLDDPLERLLRALTDLYAYYRRNQAISLHMSRDSELAGMLESIGGAYLASAGPYPEPRVLRLLGNMRPMMETRDRAVVESLLGPWEESRTTPELRAALALVVQFETWRTLTKNQGLDNEAAVRVATAMVAAVAKAPVS